MDPIGDYRRAEKLIIIWNRVSCYYFFVESIKSIPNVGTTRNLGLKKWFPEK